MTGREAVDRDQFFNCPLVSTTWESTAWSCRNDKPVLMSRNSPSVNAWCRSGTTYLRKSVELLKSYCLPFLLYGFDAVTLSDADARILDRCLDRAVYRIFGVCDKDNVSYLRTLLGLHSVSNSIVVCFYSYCYLSVCVLLCVSLSVSICVTDRQTDRQRDLLQLIQCLHCFAMAVL